MITDLLTIMAVVVGMILAFMPWAIFRELKRQGKAREEEALKLITLLARIAGLVPDQAADETARIQARIDAQLFHEPKTNKENIA